MFNWMELFCINLHIKGWIQYTLVSFVIGTRENPMCAPSNSCYLYHTGMEPVGLDLLALDMWDVVHKHQLYGWGPFQRYFCVYISILNNFYNLTHSVYNVKLIYFLWGKSIPQWPKYSKLSKCIVLFKLTLADNIGIPHCRNKRHS